MRRQSWFLFWVNVKKKIWIKCPFIHSYHHCVLNIAISCTTELFRTIYAALLSCAFFSWNHPSISLSEIMTPMELMIINLTLLIPIHTFAACFIVQNPLNHSKVTILVTNSPCTTSTIQHFCIVSHLPSCESALSGIRTHDLPIRKPSC